MSAEASVSLSLQRAKIARLEKAARRDPSVTPDLHAARTEYRAAKLEDHIRQTVDAAPPLTDEQRARLAHLLRPAAGGSA